MHKLQWFKDKSIWFSSQIIPHKGGKYILTAKTYLFWTKIEVYGNAYYSCRCYAICFMVKITHRCLYFICFHILILYRIFPYRIFDDIIVQERYWWNCFTIVYLTVYWNCDCLLKHPSSLYILLKGNLVQFLKCDFLVYKLIVPSRSAI